MTYQGGIVLARVSLAIAWELYRDGANYCRLDGEHVGVTTVPISPAIDRWG
jgi:hypothetical protein